jgi:hypothetical protein
MVQRRHFSSSLMSFIGIWGFQLLEGQADLKLSFSLDPPAQEAPI